jgi:hypothetical protein
MTPRGKAQTQTDGAAFLRDFRWAKSKILYKGDVIIYWHSWQRFFKHISKENKTISNAYISVVKIAAMVLKMCAMCNDLSFDEGSQMANISHCAKNS